MSEDADRLAAIQARLAAATRGPWYWNTYSGIFAEVPPGYPLNIGLRDVQEFGWIAAICDTPHKKSRGDELQAPEARANADFIANAPEDVAWLVQRIRELEGERG